MNGVFLLVAAVLGLAGVAKVLSPLPATRAVQAVGGPAQPALVRLLGFIEAIIAAAAMVWGGAWLALAVAALYLGFAGFLALALRVPGGLANCGCFGAVGAEPTRGHAALNLAAAAIAGAAAVTPVPGIVDVLADQPAAGLPLLALIGMGTALVWVLFSTGGRARAVDRIDDFALLGGES